MHLWFFNQIDICKTANNKAVTSHECNNNKLTYSLTVSVSECVWNQHVWTKWSDRVEKLMNALVGWMVCWQHAYELKFWWNRLSSKRSVDRVFCRSNGHTENSFFLCIHTSFRMDATAISFQMPVGNLFTLHSDNLFAILLALWILPKLKSCAKSANNACDISLKISTIPNTMANLCHEIAECYDSSWLYFCCRINAFCSLRI